MLDGGGEGKGRGHAPPPPPPLRRSPTHHCIHFFSIFSAACLQAPRAVWHAWTGGTPAMRAGSAMPRHGWRASPPACTTCRESLGESFAWGAAAHRRERRGDRGKGYEN